MSKFRDLDEVLLAEPKELPIGGKTYRFPGDVSGRTGLLLQRMVNGALTGYADGGDDQAAMTGAVASLDTELLSDVDELNVREEVLGDTEAEMLADGLTAAQIRHVWITLLIWHALGEDAAVACWQGKAEAPNRAARRQATRATTGRSTGAATTTRRRASTSGTSSRTTSKRKPRAAR